MDNPSNNRTTNYKVTTSGHDAMIDYSYDVGSLKELEIELMDYINWYNNHRLHGLLGYLTPMEYKEKQISLNGSKDKISVNLHLFKKIIFGSVKGER